jgi:hypothetical protein
VHEIKVNFLTHTNIESNWFDAGKLYNPEKHERIRKDIFEYLKSHYN